MALRLEFNSPPIAKASDISSDPATLFMVPRLQDILVEKLLSEAGSIENLLKRIKQEKSVPTQEAMRNACHPTLVRMLSQAVIDDNRGTVRSILDFDPHLLLVEPANVKVTEIQCKHTFQRFLTEKPLVMAQKLHRLEMTRTLLPYFENLGKESDLSKQWILPPYDEAQQQKDERLREKYINEYFKPLADTLIKDPCTRSVTALEATTEKHLESVRNAFLPEKPVAIDNYVDPEQLLIAAYKAYADNFDRLDACDKRRVFANRVIDLVMRLVSPEIANVFCQPNSIFAFANQRSLPFNQCAMDIMFHGTPFYQFSRHTYVQNLASTILDSEYYSNYEFRGNRVVDKLKSIVEQKRRSLASLGSEFQMRPNGAILEPSKWENGGGYGCIMMHLPDDTIARMVQEFSQDQKDFEEKDKAAKTAFNNEENKKQVDSLKQQLDELSHDIATLSVNTQHLVNEIAAWKKSKLDFKDISSSLIQYEEKRITLDRLRKEQNELTIKREYWHDRCAKITNPLGQRALNTLLQIMKKQEFDFKKSLDDYEICGMANNLHLEKIRLCDAIKIECDAIAKEVASDIKAIKQPSPPAEILKKYSELDFTALTIKKNIDKFDEIYDRERYLDPYNGLYSSPYKWERCRKSSKDPYLDRTRNELLNSERQLRSTINDAKQLCNNYKKQQEDENKCAAIIKALDKAFESDNLQKWKKTTRFGSLPTGIQQLGAFKRDGLNSNNILTKFRMIAEERLAARKSCFAVLFFKNNPDTDNMYKYIKGLRFDYLYKLNVDDVKKEIAGMIPKK